VAEKFQAMVVLGIANSRMKDSHDLWVLANAFEFDGPTLCRAIRATFHRRKTALPTGPPLALTAEFGTNAAKVTQWEAFVRKAKLGTGGITLEQVCAHLHGFLMPLTDALVAGVTFQQRMATGWSVERARSQLSLRVLGEQANRFLVEGSNEQGNWMVKTLLITTSPTAIWV
jgi:hypothetical protein